MSDSSSEQDKPRTVIRVGKLEYPPEIQSDGSLLYTGTREPKETGWHERDRDNPMRLESIGVECEHRRMELRPKCCGNASIRMVCECEACPIYGQNIVPTDCELCQFSSPGAGEVRVYEG